MLTKRERPQGNVSHINAEKHVKRQSDVSHIDANKNWETTR